jgi:hypothetical protein
MPRKAPAKFPTAFFNDVTIKKLWSQNDLYHAREVAIDVIIGNHRAKETSKRKALRDVENAPTMTQLITLCTNMMLKASGDGVIANK